MDNKKHNFSPHPSPLIKFGQINVNGLCSPVRQQHLLNFFLHSSFGALSVNDTRLSPSNTKFIFKNEYSQHHFRSYWACSSSSRPHDDVGILLRNPLHKHVQIIDPWKGRLLKLDLFFHQTKISIISIYYPPSGSIHQSICNDLIAKLLSWLDYARTNNYFVIILGDFNIDEVAHSHYSSNHFKLLRLLSSRVFTDHQATFFHDNGSSRLDYIWSSPGFPAPGLFSQVITCPNLLDRPFTDHKVLTTVFDFSSCLAILAKSRLKQKKEMRTIFSYASTSVEQWNNFTTEVDDSLGVYLDKQYHPNIDFSSLSLDLPSYSTTPVSVFKSFLRSQKNLVSAFLSTKFAQHLSDSVEYYTALRDEHFSNSLGTFIDSALSVEKRSIVLDRVLVVLDSTPTLLTDPSDIKQAAITHFQSIISPPLDYIWSSPGFPAPGLFSQVVACPNLLDRSFTDHKVLITIFDFSSCLAILARSRLKQKKEMRTIFTYTFTLVEQWINFAIEVDDSLGVYLDKQYHSGFDFSSLSLDHMWHALKAAILSAAVETLPFQKVSNTH
ncbi:DNase I-like protein [Rhizophagus irregularis]|uniref:DNase I-like protein n=1 Tax=Rhizophagus irregularis TaxID=588596 RepID=A0A2N1MUY7_9GLOM|nr:DNase I-like protein [Rhizophagus irregularis]